MTTDAHKRRIEVRKRLFGDFDYYAANALKIRTKDGEIVNLRLNEAQRRLLEIVKNQYATEGRVRVIILKARQIIELKKEKEEKDK